MTFMLDQIQMIIDLLPLGIALVQTTGFTVDRDLEQIVRPLIKPDEHILARRVHLPVHRSGVGIKLHIVQGIDNAGVVPGLLPDRRVEPLP